MRVRAHPGGADSASEHWEATLGGSHLPRLPRNVFDLPPTHPATPLTSHPVIHSSTQSSTHPSQSAVHPSIHTPSHPLIHPVSHPSTLPVIHPSSQSSTHPLGHPLIHPPSPALFLPSIHLFTSTSTCPPTPPPLHSSSSIPPSVLFSRSVISSSLQPHGLQHTRPPCPSPTPRAHSSSCPLSQ